MRWTENPEKQVQFLSLPQINNYFRIEFKLSNLLLNTYNLILL
jgi:hypothetical protein